MTKKTIKAVKDAEVTAAIIEEDALRKKDEILSKAQKKAKYLISSTIKNANNKANEDYNDAVRKGEHIVEEAKVKAEKEALMLREMIKSKEQAAIELILSTVI